jgi:hypothetical protein
MGLTVKERKLVTGEIVRRYRTVGKKRTGRILEELVKTTGYHRKYAISLFRAEDRAHHMVMIPWLRPVNVRGSAQKHGVKPRKRGKKQIHSDGVRGPSFQ